LRDGGTTPLNPDKEKAVQTEQPVVDEAAAAVAKHNSGTNTHRRPVAAEYSTKFNLVCDLR